MVTSATTTSPVTIAFRMTESQDARPEVNATFEMIYRDWSICQNGNLPYYSAERLGEWESVCVTPLVVIVVCKGDI